jgi:ribosomal protein L16 Arg81 hydroxylase
MIRDCRQRLQERQWQPRQGPSQGRQVETDENEQIAQIVADNRTPQQRADDWFKNIANEDDETKDIVMQTLWKQEDFPNA